MNRHRMIYIVDDDTQVRESLRNLVEATGYEARCFGSGQELLTEYQAGDAGCVIVDYRMVGMNGLELQERLRESDATLPVIMMSGHYHERDRLIAIERGAVGLLSKPFSSMDLRMKLKLQ